MANPPEGSEKILSHEEARRFYDRMGARQDSQAFYEDVATDALVEHGAFDEAWSVFEFGCGTGRFAEKLLGDRLPANARYCGLDLSPRMVGLSERRLAAFGDRAQVVLSDGSPRIDQADASYDRFVSSYVLDLLSQSEIRTLLEEAHRLLRSGGLLCIASLSPGHGTLSKALIGVWKAVHRINPSWVGGCRPIELLPMLDPERWGIRHHESMAPYGIPSEVVVARRNQD